MQKSRLKVVLKRDSFSIKDLPQLIRELERNHNMLAHENIKLYPGRNEGVWRNNYFLEVTRRIGSEYYFWAERLKKAVTNIDGIEQTAALEEINKYIDELQTLANSFGITTENYSEKEVSSWTKEISVYQHGDPATETDNFTRHLKYLKSKNFYNGRFEEFRGIVRNLVNTKVNQSLEDDLLNFVFERGQAEIMHLSDAGNILEQVLAGKIDPLAEFLEKETTNKGHFGILRQRFQELRQQLTTANPDGRKNLVTELSNLQVQIAGEINAIIYNPRYWVYDRESFDTHSTLYKIANCVARGNLQNIIWKQIFAEETFGAVTAGHFFSVLKLADGRLLNLDSLITGEPEFLSDITIKEGIQQAKSISTGWILVGNHSRMACASILGWMSSQKKSEFALRQAVRLLPENPQFHLALATQFIQLEKGFREVEKELTVAIRLAPNNPIAHDILGILYYESTDPNHWPIAEKELQQALELSKHYDTNRRPRYCVNLARCYLYKLNQPQKAKQLLEEALSLMDQGGKNIYTKEEIGKDMQEIASRLATS